MAKDSDEAADRPWNGDKAGWIEAEKLFDRKMALGFCCFVQVFVAGGAALACKPATSCFAVAPKKTAKPSKGACPRRKPQRPKGGG